MARAIVHGVDPVWIRDPFGSALVPDVAFYLHAERSGLIPLVLKVCSFDYWESGIDFLPSRDHYEALVEYQTRLLAQFEAMAEKYDFHRIDASQSVRDVFRALKTEIEQVLADMKPIPPQKAKEELAQAVAEEKDRRKKRKRTAGRRVEAN